ncbi:MAG: recombination mediator RecR [Coriobacteriales bacterium]|nr:recombination mediator RecR [Coriobacteriales bacterium]
MTQSITIQKLLDEFERLPGIGPKSAQRIVYWLLNNSDTDARRLADAIVDVKEHVHFCKRCFNYSEAELCPICANLERDTSIICVVSEPRDVTAIERTGEFNGAYHVLGGAISPIDGIGPDQLTISALLARLVDTSVTEVLLATNPNVEGETTAVYLARLIKPLGIKTSRLASGLPVGGDLEFADSVTLARAIESRREL